MGVLPLTFEDGTTRKTLGLDGTETISIAGINDLTPHKTLIMTITRQDGSQQQVPLLCRVDTVDEADYYRHGGILPYVLRGMAAA